MAAIAARTTTIRIGSAGVMLPHYSALKVAEQFRVLEALAPGRIDLGLGRAPGGDMRTARALNPNASHGAEDFPVQVRDLAAWTSIGTLRRHHRASARTARARDLDPRQLRLRRAARGALRPALCVRLFLHRRPRRRAGDGALPAPLPAERAPSRAEGDALHLGARRRDRRRGRAPRAVARPLAHRPGARRARAAAVARRDRRARLRRRRGGRASRRCAQRAFVGTAATVGEKHRAGWPTTSSSTRW